MPYGFKKSRLSLPHSSINCESIAVLFFFKLHRRKNSFPKLIHERNVSFRETLGVRCTGRDVPVVVTVSYKEVHSTWRNERDDKTLKFGVGSVENESAPSSKSEQPWNFH